MATRNLPRPPQHPDWGQEEAIWRERLVREIERIGALVDTDTDTGLPAGGSTTTVLHGPSTGATWAQVNLATTVTGTLPATNGGTGLAAYAVGDILYADRTTSLARRAIGSAGDVLSVSGGLPQWVTPASLGLTNLWTRVGASGHLHPATSTDIVSIGATTAPNNSAALGLFQTLGVSHINGATVADGEGIAQWAPESSFTGGSTAEQAANAMGAGRAVWRLRTETSNAVFLGADGTDYFAITLNISGFPAIVPLDANGCLGGADTSPIEGWRALYLQTGSGGSNQGIQFGSGGINYAYVYHDATNLYFRAAAGEVRIRTDAATPGRLSFYSGTTELATMYYHSTGPVRRWLPGSDASTDIGGLAGTADNERWRNIYQSGLWVGNDADVASATTVTPTTNTLNITGTTTINHITTNVLQGGTWLVLMFNDNVTVTHDAGSPPANTAPILLAGAANFSATANDTLMLVYDGTDWREVARTVI